MQSIKVKGHTRRAPNDGAGDNIELKRLHYALNYLSKVQEKELRIMNEGERGLAREKLESLIQEASNRLDILDE